MSVEDAVRELAQVVAGCKDDESEEEITYIEAPANPQDGDTLVYDESEGKWIAGGGGGGVFVVSFILNQDGETYSCDKTFEEIVEAYESGKVLMSYMIDDASSCAVSATCDLTFNDITGRTVLFDATFYNWQRLITLFPDGTIDVQSL